MNNTERNEEILRLWKDGMTGAQIAENIGVTRNAVLGLIHRMKQKGESLERKVNNRVFKVKEIKVKKQIRKLKEETRMPSGILNLRRDSCRFIVEDGDEKQTRYCNQKIHRASYCQEHYKICYYTSKSGSGVKSA